MKPMWQSRQQHVWWSLMMGHWLQGEVPSTSYSWLWKFDAVCRSVCTYILFIGITNMQSSFLSNCCKSDLLIYAVCWKMITYPHNTNQQEYYSTHWDKMVSHTLMDISSAVILQHTTVVSVNKNVSFPTKDFEPVHSTTVSQWFYLLHTTVNLCPICSLHLWCIRI